MTARADFIFVKIRSRSHPMWKSVTTLYYLHFLLCLQTSHQYTRPLGSWVSRLAKHLILTFTVRVQGQSWPRKKKSPTTTSSNISYEKAWIELLRHPWDAITGWHHHKGRLISTRCDKNVLVQHLSIRGDMLRFLQQPMKTHFWGLFFLSVLHLDAQLT